MNRDEAVSRAADLITALYQAFPEGAPERLFVPGITLTALWEFVADHGWDLSAEEMVDILRDAQSQHNLPNAIVEPLMAVFPVYGQVYRELMEIEWEEHALPTLLRLKARAEAQAAG